MISNDLLEIVLKKYNLKNFNFYGDEIINSFFLGFKLLQNNKDKNVLILTKNNYISNKLYNAFSLVLPKEKVILMPSDELIRVEYISQSKEMLAQQVNSLNEIIKSKNSIAIASIQSCFRFYPTKKVFLDSIIKLKVGEEIDLDFLKHKITEIGYYRVNKIDQSLQFASRGDILDIYSLNYDDPIRIEFFDNVIESIRFFHVNDQSSYTKTNSVEILPATLNLLSEDEIKNAKNTILQQCEKDLKHFLNQQDRDEFINNVNNEIENFEENRYSNQFYKYIGFLQGFHCNLTDFFNEDYLIISNKIENEANLSRLISESDSFLNELFELRKCISNLHYFSLDNCNLNKSLIIYENENLIKDERNITANITPPRYVFSKQSVGINIFDVYKKDGYKIICFIENLIFYKKTVELLNSLNYAFSSEDNLDLNFNIQLVNKEFPLSFELLNEKIVVLTEKELYGIKRHKSTYKSIFKEGVIINSYEELTRGDFVVHENYGIGEYFGITTIELNNIHQDYMEVHYANNEKLFVPLYQFNLIRKYVGREGKKPTLSRLGTNQWEKTKKKIKERVNVLADRLLLLYQERSKIKGFSFKIEDELQKEFENEFDHELTIDQKKAIEDIKKDMEKDTPMDRLLSGDVGFGKTEVAFRAAFKALNNGKQVALMCPTTLLARQHYELALNRFKNFNFGIGLISRLQSETQNKKTLENIKTGKINFIIGTHKLLSKKVLFKDLGLLIIDEEQRFGVEQKEKIKEMCNNIDVLTLSATPIPRTLQSTLIGIKTISSITTPPKERMPIQTYVIPYDNKVLKEIIQRELSRQGQIFFVHNEIATIYERADEIQSLLPSCKIGIIHAKMDKSDIEDVMVEFYNGEIDLLIATSIIENGIDVRNANLIIIDNADKFGLAQLYQIKGRVGRGDRMAFAYLLVDREKALNEGAQKRLKAITEFTELGSGIKISQRDLLIRGAGDILGPEQAGFIDTVGIDMYIKILNETIEEKSHLHKLSVKAKQFNLNINGYIPSSFVNDENKLQIYQDLLKVNTLDELEEEKDNIRDVYGKIPEEVELLLIKRKVEIYLNYDCFESLKEFETNIQLVLSEKFSMIEGIGSSLFTALISLLKYLKISYIDKKINISISKKSDYVFVLLNVFEIVYKLYNINANEN
ncbi:MAG: transcription-repair coupling factor [Candidatus Onthovivens sp.]|nr:transcription-repair coupling factor [Candidatus Onthovivens sp.]